ncbi:MAG: hypothetical protein JNK04_20515 [Myxococcales bacterium]|nr:hypothetical protein [Myxococcales bacterium]
MSATKELRCFDYVNRPFIEVRDTLRENPNDIFRRATNGAAGRAESLVATLHVDVAGLELGKDVEIVVKKVWERTEPSLGPMIVFQLEWHAAAGSSFFPSMKADLSVYRLGKDETQLELAGTYEPPLGTIGKVLDALVMHRVAEASVHRFVGDVAALLKTEPAPN